MKTYDILNAGPRNRFMANGRIVSNSGRLVQVQNLPQNHIDYLDVARQLVRTGDLDTLNMLIDDIPDILSQLIRTAFVAPKGSRFIIADFSAIEARVIAWLAGEKWRLDVFNSHGRIYEASASEMFKVPIEAVTKGSALRQKAKIAELALGYQGGPGALMKMGAVKMGLTEEELPGLVKMWRNANRKIVQLWYTYGDAALKAVKEGGRVRLNHNIYFLVEKGILFIQLPSGRKLSYIRPRIHEGAFGDIITYEGMDQTTKTWKEMDAYGGRFSENLCQSIARDCLADAMIRLHDKGYKIVMHVHDEFVMEMPYGKGSIDEVNKIMAEPISWAPGLPLKAESHESEYYKKD